MTSVYFAIKPILKFLTLFGFFQLNLHDAKPELTNSKFRRSFLFLLIIFSNLVYRIAKSSEFALKGSSFSIVLMNVETAIGLTFAIVVMMSNFVYRKEFLDVLRGFEKIDQKVRI
jgi:hypothetical protein